MVQLVRGVYQVNPARSDHQEKMEIREKADHLGRRDTKAEKETRYCH